MTNRVVHSLTVLTMLFLLAACGGGGSVTRDNPQSGGGQNPPNGDNPTVTVSITGLDGSATTELTQDTPLVVSALVVDAQGAPLVGELVTFEISSETLGSFDNDTGTGLTDEDGIATIGLIVGSATGSGEVTATIAVGDAGDASGAAGFSAVGAGVSPTEPSITLSVRQQDGSAGDTVTADSPLVVEAVVVDATQSPVAGALVTFSFSQEGLASFDNDAGSAVTNASGIATIGLVAGSQTGSALVIGEVELNDVTLTGDVAFTSQGAQNSQVTITMSIEQQDGSAGNVVSEQTPLVVRATAVDANQQPIVDTLVTFSLSPENLARFNNDTGTGLTNASGTAEIGLLVDTNSGSGLVTASITIGDGDPITADIGFSSTGTTTAPGVTTVSLTISQQDGTPGNRLTEATPLLVTATVLDANQNPIVDRLLTFSLAPESLAVFSNSTGTALTDANGIATIGMLVSTDSGSGVVTGVLDSGELGSVGFVSEGTSEAVEVPNSLDFFASLPQLPSSGRDTIQLRAIVKNARNVLLEDVAVEFSADADASISNVQSQTDATGTATADLTTLNNPENRIITATASITGFPALTRQIEISVVGTSISVVGANGAIIGDTVDFAVLVSDSDNVGISGVGVGVTVLNETGQTVETISDLITNVDGRAEFEFTADSAGDYTIVANALNSQTTFSLIVQQDAFAFAVDPEQSIPLDTQWFDLDVAWSRDGSPFVGGDVTLFTSRGEIQNSMVTTDNNGVSTFRIRADNAGLASLVAFGSDGSGDEPLTARIDVRFIAVDAATVIVDATPDAIGPNGQTATISAVVRDASGNRVSEQPVNFSVFDVSNGSLNPPIVNTDFRGIASTVYTSNVVSAIEAVTVTATVGSVSGETTLTVGDRPFDISLGTGRLIDSPEQSSYRKEFSVFVTDSSGNPVANTPVTMSITPVPVTEGDSFALGDWLYNEDDQVYVPVNYHFDPITGEVVFIDSDGNGIRDPGEVTAVFEPFTCPSEDVNRNGILDAGEDSNMDGQLTPGNVAAITESVTTDQNGQALVFVDYPRQFGAWVTLKITAQTGSEGSESSESMLYTLGVALDDINVLGSPPPPSPFGVGNQCDVMPRFL